MLSVPRLRLLRELHVRGTIAAAAQALSYTPSAVSQQLAQLERESGVALLERIGRGVTLTPAAIALVEHAEAVFDRLELAESELAAAQPEITGTLRVASFQSVVLAVLPGTLQLMAERHPHLQIDVTQREVGEAYDGLRSTAFDLIIGEEYPDETPVIRAGIDRADLLVDPICLALPSHGPHAVRPRTLTDLAEIPWVLDPVSTPTGVWARTLCRRAGFEPHVRFDSPDPLVHAHLVRSGLAAAFMAALLAPDHLSGIDLIGLPGQPHRVLQTAARTGRSAHPAVVAFRSALSDAIAAQAPSGPPWTRALAG